MSVPAELLVAMVMLVGLVGVVVPVLPGLALIWAAALVWVLLDGGGVTRWVVLGLLTLLLAAGTVAKYAVPARRATSDGAPRTTLLLGVVGAVVGFLVLPVVGLIAGGLLGIYLAELARLRHSRAAWASTRSVLTGIGIGALIELVAGVVMVFVWAAAAVVT